MQYEIAQEELLFFQFGPLQVAFVAPSPVCAQALLLESVFVTTDPLFPYLFHSQLQQSRLPVSF